MKKPGPSAKTVIEGPPFERVERRPFLRPGHAEGCAPEPDMPRVDYAVARNFPTDLPHSRPSVMAMASDMPGIGVMYS